MAGDVSDDVRQAVIEMTLKGKAKVAVPIENSGVAPRVKSSEGLLEETIRHQLKGGVGAETIDEGVRKEVTNKISIGMVSDIMRGMLR